MLYFWVETDNTLANTDEGTTSAPTGVNTTEDLIDPVCKSSSSLYPCTIKSLI
jgi:hypothetical protein